MISKAKSPDAYIASLPESRKEAVGRLRNTILKNLPEGFQETMSYGMIGYVVPHSIYPDGYHCDPKLPLPFMNLASQKNYIAVYHSGIYAIEDLYKWFRDEYPKHVSGKPDMGKSCIRFKKVEAIPYELIGQLCRKLSVEQWIKTYEFAIKKKD